ncbi:CYTH and CHAD domain-containing protein [Streptomyces sp. JJ38]|uniref:CYTH and CHAD domain-containing protein n=1 Tax=Streptomyces sp. JJ38 TaxID=2738128 RepID=UPI001C57C890|nr:CYTH and CHAD domain-containing protein [Streptomyces sp. JJ38]MBW1598974.1 CYTH and CHAD domain-containing protein [Streptomyces sp. JJ38]
MVDAVRETERKYEAADDIEPPDVRVRGVDSVVDAGRQRLDAVYYDTADGRLAASGVTLRRRTGGSHDGWHLKLPVGPDVREEIRAPLAAEVPRELIALVRSRVREAPLVPVMELVSERRARGLRDAEGRPLAEVSVDRVRARRPAGAAGRPARWTEVEAELAADGRPKLLDRIEKRLLAAGLRRARATSKLERALAETAPEEGPPGSAPEPAGPAPGTAGACVLDYVREQVEALIALDPAVRRDVPDSVHRMRVATRRLRSCFRSASAVLDRAVTDPLGEELRRLAAGLAQDRDREVLAARLSERLAELPPALRLGPVADRLRAEDRARQGGSRSRVIDVLDDPRHLILLRELEELLADPPLRPAAERPAPEVLARVLRRDVGRLDARVGRALRFPPGDERDRTLHEARKAAKRARYAAEAARPALGKRAKRATRALTSVQTLLGEHQDSVVARRALRELALRAHAAGEPSFTYGLLHAREAALAEGYERELPRLWRSVHGRLPG